MHQRSLFILSLSCLRFLCSSQASRSQKISGTQKQAFRTQSPTTLENASWTIYGLNDEQTDVCFKKNTVVSPNDAKNFPGDPQNSWKLESKFVDFTFKNVRYHGQFSFGETGLAGNWYGTAYPAGGKPYQWVAQVTSSEIPDGDKDFPFSSHCHSGMQKK
jgi:hypothetical protein